MSDNLYKNGLPFSDKLAENIKDLYLRVKESNKAGCIIIDGGVGEGKTTLAVEIGDYINSLDGKQEIDLDVKECFQIGMGGASFIRNLKVVFKKGYPVLIYDEGGDFNRRGALTQFNQMINRIFETYRAFKVVVIICLPSFRVIDSDLLLKGIPRLLLHCQDRSRTYGDFKAYSLYRMFYIIDKMKKLKVPSFAYQLEEPNFSGHFLNLSKEREKALDKLSTNSKLLEVEKAEIKMDGLISTRDICRKLAKSDVWVCHAIRELKIKPVRKIGKTWYYNEDVIDSLYAHSIKPIVRRTKEELKKQLTV